MTTGTHAQYLQSHTAFILAEIFHPADAPALAAQCLLPVADVLAAGRARQAFPEPWLSVQALGAYVGKAEVSQTLIDEAWVADLVATLRRRMRDWPRLWQAPVRAYIAAECAVQMDDPRALAALAREAAAARREAIEVLYGAEGLAYYGSAAWEGWMDGEEAEAEAKAAP